MQILVNSNHSVNGTEALAERVEAMVADAVDHLADRITRIEVHLHDVNGDKHGAADKRCMLEARIGGMKPIAVTQHAATMGDAIQGAAAKLERALSHALGRLDDKAGREPRDAEIASVETLERLEDPAQRGRNS